MKLGGAVEDGAGAKEEVQKGSVKVNGEIETRRGRKLYHNDVFSFHQEEYRILSS